MNALSKSAREFLDENGYRLTEKDGLIYIKHANSNRLFFFLIGILCVPGALIFGMVAPLYVGIPLLGLVVALTIVYVRKSNQKIGILIPIQGSWMAFQKGNKELRKIPFQEVDEIGWDAAFVSEYASANKVSSTEYRHTISIRLQNGELIPLVHFIGEYEEPEAPFQEIYSWLSALIKSGKSS